MLCIFSFILYVFCFHVFDVHYLFLHTVQFVHSCIYAFLLLFYVISLLYPSSLLILHHFFYFYSLIYSLYMFECIDVFSFMLSSHPPPPFFFCCIAVCLLLLFSLLKTSSLSHLSPFKILDYIIFTYVLRVFYSTLYQPLLLFIYHLCFKIITIDVLMISPPPPFNIFLPFIPL